jgi:PKD repeat protein
MGDGASKSGLRVTHSYTAPGTYLVSLTVTDTGGRSASISKSVAVATGNRPSASFSYSPSSPGVSQDIYFTAAASTAAPGRRLVSYEWDFGTGRTATGVSAVKRYDQPGTYTVTLLVTDDLGQTGSTTQTVQVAPSAAGGISAALVASPTSPKANQAIQFNAVGSRPSDGATLVEYRFNFGVPGAADVIGSSPIVNFTYTTTGTYVVTVQVRDSAGRTAMASITITVTN